MVIDEKWRIDVESNGGVALVLAEVRIRKSGKDTGKEYLFEDKWYYSNVHQALKQFLIKSIEDSIDVKSCIERIEKSLLKIESLSF